MPAVNDVGEPCAGEPHARFEVAGAGKGVIWPRTQRDAQPTGKPAEDRTLALPPRRSPPRQLPTLLRLPYYAPYPIFVWLNGHEWAQRE
jgi:hypothetical protein